MAQRLKVRDDESKVEDLKVDSHDIDVELEVFNNISPQSFTSASHHGDHENMQISFSASGSQDSYDSSDIFFSREDLSPICTNITSNAYNLRQDSSISYENLPADDSPRMHQFNSRLSEPDAMEELRAEAKMWERNARKLMMDLDMLRKDFSDQSKNQADLEMELSATQVECYGLRKEVERLKLLSGRFESLDDSTFQGEGTTHLHKELEPSNGGYADLVTEMEGLKEKVQELERDCNELTDENLELLFKLKEINNKPTCVCTSCTDDNHDVLVQEFEISKMEFESKVAELEANLMSKEEGIAELEAKVAELEKENIHLAENMKAVARESDITSKCFNDLQNDLVTLSANKSESGRLELEHFKTLAENLQDEVMKLRNRMEIQKVELNQKLHDMKRRCSGVEEECEYLRRSKLELQATAEKLVDENVVLHENFAKFEAKLDALLEENKKQEGKLVEEEVLFSEIEAYLQEVDSKLRNAENDLNVIHIETDEMVEGLRAELSATKLEKEELEGSLHQALGECKEIKAENTSLVDKIEDCKHSRAALEKKLLEMECDHNRINITNGQLQRKIQQLEKDKDECVTKSQSLEDEFKAVKAHNAAKINAKVSPAREDMKFFAKSERAKSPNRHHDSRRKLSSKNDQAREPVRNRLKPSNIQHHKEGSNGSWVHGQHPQTVDLDSFSKIQWLENELAKAVEANKTYKAQLNRLRSGSQIPHYGGEVVPKERFERTKSLLETELKDIRDRYLHMSLRYAEVEAQREELVMKLKAARKDRRWFS